MAAETTIEQPWYLTVCTADPAWSSVGNNWYDAVDPYTNDQVRLPECPNADCGSDSCNAPTVPYMCYTYDDTDYLCPAGTWSCGVRNTLNNQSYDIQGSSYDGRVCAAADPAQCPVFGASAGPGFTPVTATAVALNTLPINNNGQYDLQSPNVPISNNQPVNLDTPAQPITCTYNVADFFNNPMAMYDLVDTAKNWSTVLTEAGVLPWPASTASENSIPQGVTDANGLVALANATTVMGQFCGQSAQANSLQQFCPIDPQTGQTMVDCQVMSTLPPPNQTPDGTTPGEICRTWCQLSPNDCNNTLTAGCDASNTPDCGCYNRIDSSSYTDISQGLNQTAFPGMAARCWYLPCSTGTGNLDPVIGPTYLVDQNTSAQSCPSNVQICEVLNQIYNSGTMNKDSFKDTIDCSTSNGNNNNSSTPPKLPPGEWFPPTPGVPLWITSPPTWLIVLVFCLLGALLVLGALFFYRRRHHRLPLSIAKPTTLPGGKPATLPPPAAKTATATTK